MSYFRASTDNPNGWRPGTVLLGNPASVQHRGPDWKAVAEQHDANMRAGRQTQSMVRRAQYRRAAAADAYARGDRMTLSGLSGLDLNAQMARGATYVFHFTYGGLGIRPGMDAVTNAVAADTNFSSPVAATENSGVQVRFVYNGQGATVGSAGSEMQNVVNTFSVMGVANSLQFSSAEGGPAQTSAAAAATGKQVFTTSPDGTLIQFTDGSVLDLSSGMTINPDGTIASAGGTPPGGTPNPNNPSAFNWSSFWAGMGLTAGVGTALAIGAGILLLKD